MTYDFKTLSPEDFEALIADLFSREFGATLESFKSGKDQGIDLRHSRQLPAKDVTIIQCKRYAQHDFAGLHRTLKAELPKLQELKPTRYIVATSVALSPHNKDQLLETLQPWCRAPGDLYGSTEINAMLRRFPDVVRAHFKLWVSNTEVLERVIHSRIFNHTDDTIEEIQAQICKLVVHDGMQRARTILDSHHHVLIVGNPGIGKTTLARMLLCHYLMEGFVPIDISGDIADAWAIVRGNTGSQQKFIVLYDDFLGQLNYDSQRFGKNEEMSLGKFLRKVQRSDHIRFILTTREYILADARRVHGAFDKQAEQLEKCIISLDDYTVSHRAKVLFNHLYFSNLPHERLVKLVERRVYRRLIEHKHFSPRIIEAISDHANSRAMSDDDYLSYIEREFADPNRVWDHPFRQEVSPTAREVLFVLWSFGIGAGVKELKQAHRRLHSHSVTSDLSQEAFDSALRSLDGNFLWTRRYPVRGACDRFEIAADFQNPSVREYVENRVYAEPDWAQMLISTIVNFTQVRHLFFAGEEIESKWSRKMPHEFWTGLNDAAQRLDGVSSAHVIKYFTDDGTRVEEWIDQWPDTADRLTLRFRIAHHLGPESAARRDLLNRLTIKTTWADLLPNVATHERVAWEVIELVRWLMSCNADSAGKMKAIGNAFRAHLREMLNTNDEIWRISIGSLRVLAEAVLSFRQTLRADEKEAFVSVAKLVVGTRLRHEESPDRLRNEARFIVELGEFCGTDFSSERRELEDMASARSAHAAPRQRWWGRSASYADDKDTILDIDSLFSDLKDR